MLNERELAVLRLIDRRGTALGSRMRDFRRQCFRRLFGNADGGNRATGYMLSFLIGSLIGLLGVIISTLYALHLRDHHPER